MTPAPFSPIKVAIVGLGRAGWGLHFLPLSKMPQFQITAVADPDKKRIAEASALVDCQAFSSLDELLTVADADLIVIATPSQFHYGDARKVIASSRHCILEKPMALNWEDAQTLVEQATQSGKQLFVHHNLLHGPEFHQLNSLLQSGKLGSIFHLRRFRGNYRWRNDWQTIRKYGGGILNNHGPHMLSTVLPLLGSKVTQVHADIVQVKDAGDSEDHVHLVLRTENGVTADLVISSSIALGMPAWLICGQYGTLISEENGFKLRYCLPEDLRRFATSEPNSAENEKEIAWIEEHHPIPSTAIPSFHQNVYDTLVHGALPLVTPQSAAEVMRVTSLAMTSQADDGTPKSLV